jgi:hypothetical protein
MISHYFDKNIDEMSLHSLNLYSITTPKGMEAKIEKR